jgi:hypothetical protein
MKKIICAIFFAFLAVQMATPAFSVSLERPRTRALVHAASLDCHAIGQKKADELGGQLARASPVVKDGQEACNIVVLIPAKDGNRPRRAEFVISN